MWIAFNFEFSTSNATAIRLYTGAKSSSIIGNTFYDGVGTQSAFDAHNETNVRFIGNTWDGINPFINANPDKLVIDDDVTIRWSEGIRLYAKDPLKGNTIYVDTDGVLKFRDINGVVHALYT